MTIPIPEFDPNKVAVDLIKSTASGAFGKLGVSIKRLFGKILVDAEIGFANYLKEAHDKISQVKTLLSNDAPCSIHDLYVAPTFSTRSTEFTEQQLIGRATKDSARTVIIGTGGGGKSIFMKYMFVQLCESSKVQRIPIFLELKSLNGLTSKNIEAALLSLNVPLRKLFDPDQFSYGLKAGIFTVILDGFDEIDHTERKEIEANLIKFNNDYPLCPIIVSGRPDPIFDSWHTFSTYRINPFSKEQTLELVEKVPFEDTQAKANFIKAIRRELYNSHRTFLSTPLLATMMLVVYAKTADVPMRMSNFYARAFYTLFYLHDASKGQFKRKLKSNMQEDEFRSVFATFCAITYMMPKYKFSREELRDLIRKSAILQSKPISEDDFIHDLFECVCMLQHDGTDIVFSHRSFQEYFAAEYMLRTPNFDVARALDSIVERGTDNVIGIMFEMNQEFLELKWISGKLSAIQDKIARLDPTENPIRYLEHFFTYFIVLDRAAVKSVFAGRRTELGCAKDTILGLYQSVKADGYDEEITRADAKQIYDHLVKIGVLNPAGGESLFRSTAPARRKKSSTTRPRGAEARIHRIPFDYSYNALFKIQKVCAFLSQEKDALLRIKEHLDQKSLKSANLIRDLFEKSR